MNDVFKTPEAPDTRGTMEKLYGEFWDKHSTDALGVGDRETRIRKMMCLFEGMSEVEARLLDQAHQDFSRNVLILFGRTLDEVPNGEALRIIAISYLLNGLNHNIGAVIEMQNAFTMMHMIQGEITVTPDCDCSVCRLGRITDHDLKKRYAITEARLR